MLQSGENDNIDSLTKNHDEQMGGACKTPEGIRAEPLAKLMKYFV
jgi:hypothetical protein